MTHQINSEKCTLCGLCRLSCPAELFEPGDKTMSFVNDAGELCLQCGHCIAACPEDAIAIEGLDPAMFPLLSNNLMGFEELQTLLLARRSVRRFKDKPVEKELVDKIIASVSTAPTGLGKVTTEICVLNGREKIDPMIKPMMEFYRKFSKGMKSGIGKVMMRSMMGKNMYTAMKDFMPIIDRMLKYYDQTGEDTLTWGAPLLLIFHAPKTAISGRHDAVIACTYAMLAAHSLGLGTTIIGVVPPYVEKSADERRRLKIPETNEIQLSLIAGYPASKFVKGIRRTVETTWV